jgi:hypothetical protein
MDEMRHTLFGTLVALLSCVAAPFAQQLPAAAPQAEPAHKVYVLTGCLEVGGATAAAFKLTDASSIGAAPGGTAEPVAVGTSGQKASYVLNPASAGNAEGMMDAVALKAHAGQRVEVTVRPVDVPAPAQPAANVEAQAAKPAEPVTERFSVTAIKRVTGTCP